jgi:hypothetical protein
LIRTSKPYVAGSIPAGGTIHTLLVASPDPS